MSDPTYPLFPVVTFLGFVLCLVPLPWHLYSWNSGTCYFMMWASLACLNQFVNSVVWADNVINSAPAWCEISIRIMLGASVGLPASSLCINRRLYQIATVQTVAVTASQKRRAVIIDTAICILFPIIFIALQYVVQGHRFNIFEDIGCYPAIYNTLLAYFISSMWSIVIGLVSGVYCVLSLKAFAHRRLQFSQFLSANSSLTVSRYFRLMALAMTDVLLTVPLAIFTIYLNATTTPVAPWISWADTHFDYSRIEQVPSLIWRQNRLLVISLEFTRWTTPFCALIFFAYFGFAEEAKRNYGRVWSAALKRFGYSRQEKAIVPSWSIQSIKRDQKLSAACLNHEVKPSELNFVPLRDIGRVSSRSSLSPTLDNSSAAVAASPPWTPQNDIKFLQSPSVEEKLFYDV